MTWVWIPATPGEKLAIVPVLGGQVLPYSICKVAGQYEAWHRGPALRGTGYWGGTMLGRTSDPNTARQMCVAHANKTPPPLG